MPFHVTDPNTGELVPLHITANGNGTYTVALAASGVGSLAVFLADADTGNLVPFQVTDNGDGTYSPVVTVSGLSSSGGSTGSGISQTAADARYVQLASYTIVRQTSAPADGALSNSEIALWYDDTTGSLKVKAKKNDGTVITGGVVLADV